MARAPPPQSRDIVVASCNGAVRRPPDGVFRSDKGLQPITVKRRDRLGGLLHEYERAA
jgi:hypothetical protein